MCGGSSKSEPGLSSFKSALDTKKDTDILTILEKDFAHSEVGKMSQDDMHFLSILQNGSTWEPQGNYCFPLPFKSNPVLPNNRAQAERRLEQLK